MDYDSRPLYFRKFTYNKLYENLETVDLCSMVFFLE